MNLMKEQAWHQAQKEEMAGNVVTHGFSDTGKKHAVDIRVVYKDNELTLRIRDNCKSFDPSEHAKSKDSEDVGNIGIRLV